MSSEKTESTRDLEDWITREIVAYVSSSEGNRLALLDGSRIYDDPIVGFACGEDPIFQTLKEVIGPFHLTPAEAMERVLGARGIPTIPAERIGVISYVLPISKATRRENAKMKDMASRRWAHTRLYGERFNEEVQAHVVSLLGREGYHAVAPQLERGIFKVFADERVGFASTWSQRHVAFAAGLGTFGLCDGLITAAGKAHRIGSVLVDRPLPSPLRTEDIHRDCLFFNGGGCMECATRCPAGAITERGHDKSRCRDYYEGTSQVVMDLYGVDTYGCGLCQTGVPCEARAPKRRGERGQS